MTKMRFKAITAENCNHPRDSIIRGKVKVTKMPHGMVPGEAECFERCVRCAMVRRVVFEIEERKVSPVLILKG